MPVSEMSPDGDAQGGREARQGERREAKISEDDR